MSNDTMFYLAQQVTTAYAAELMKLRRENAALVRQIRDFPATASDLQDRVTMLEQQLRSAIDAAKKPAV
jgi:cell division protein FtsB